MIKNEIIKFIYYDKSINKMIANIVDRKDIDNFKSLFYEEICNLDEKYLQGAMKTETILFLCTRITLNQYRSKTSRFYKEFKADKSKDFIKKKVEDDEEAAKFITNEELFIYDIVRNERITPEEKAYEADDLEERLDKEIDEDLLIEEIKNIISRLKLKEKMIVELRLYHNMRTKDISKMLNIPESTISSIWTQGLKNIRKKLDESNPNSR